MKFSTAVALMAVSLKATQGFHATSVVLRNAHASSPMQLAAAPNGEVKAVNGISSETKESSKLTALTPPEPETTSGSMVPASKTNASTPIEYTAPVTFDVGGTIYKISRALLDQFPETILAKMAAKDDDNEKEDSDFPWFIDRNGERFQYILDYMRDGQVVLPAGRVAKEAVLSDLAYYGFQNVHPNAIQVTFAVHDSIQYLEQIRVDYQAKLKVQEQQIEIQKKYLEDAKVRYYCMQLAYRCHMRFREVGQSVYLKPSYSHDEVMSRESLGLDGESIRHINVFDSAETQIIFDECLSYFGLRYDPETSKVVQTLSK